MPLRIQATVDDQAIKQAALEGGQDAAKKIILGIDLGIADVGFTKSMIKALAKSVAGDLDAKDYKSLMDKIAAYVQPNS